jgi:6-phosphofructokinase 2
VLPGTIYSVTLNPALDESISIDSLDVGVSNRCALNALDPSGKGINASRVIHRLGRGTLAFGLAGGVSGGYLSSALDREGVPHDFETIDGFTRVNVMLFETFNHERTRLLLPGPTVTRAHVMAIARRLELVSPGEIVIFGGSLPPGLPTETYAEFIVRLYDRGVRCVIDSSGAALAAALEANPLLVRTNVEDAEEVLGRRLQTDDAIVDAVCELRDRGAHYAVISRGALGAIGCGPGLIFNVKPPVRHATSAAGAGDSMTAAMAVAFNEGLSFENALRWGTAAGTATAMTQGTTLCDPRDVYRLIPAVRVERLSVVRS